MRAPGQGRADVGGVDAYFAVEARAVITAQLLPARHRSLEIGALWAARGVGDEVEGDLVGRDHAGACTGLDRHVAQGHALFHVHRFDGAATELDDVAGAAVDADHADDVQHHVLGADAGRQRAIDGDRKGLRLALKQALRGQHMADFAGADAERQRTEGPVGGCVAVAADDGHARLGEALFRRDHVDDAAIVRGHVEQLDAVLGAVACQRGDLCLGGGAGIG